MTTPCLGVIDTGFAVRHTARIVAARQFELGDDGVHAGVAIPSGETHGALVLDTLLGNAAGGVRLYVAQAFVQRPVTSAAQLAAALDWLGTCGVGLINMSVGLRHDREVLRVAVARAVARGTTLCASVPVIGGVVYPAAYPGVLRIMADARCQPGQWSLIDSASADFGAVPAGCSATGSGASMACAAFTGIAARIWRENPGLDRLGLLEALRDGAAIAGEQPRRHKL